VDDPTRLGAEDLLDLAAILPAPAVDLAAWFERRAAYAATLEADGEAPPAETATDPQEREINNAATVTALEGDIGKEVFGKDCVVTEGPETEEPAPDG
jgi:hypothetical protein